MLENKYELPPSFEAVYEHYHCPFYPDWLLMADTHAPYHDIPAISELLNYGIGKGIKAIFIDGDFLDCYSISNFNSDPTRPTMKEEIACGIELIKQLQKWTGAKIFYKFGNHERRLEHYLRYKAPEIFGCEEFELKNLMKLNELGVEFIKENQIAYIGRLPILHGHEIGLKNVMVNPARSLFLKTQKSAICAHLHIPSQHNQKSPIDGKIISTWSIGHLGDEHPEYNPHNGWVHGGARIEVDAEGDYEVMNLRLIGNKIHRT